MISTLCVAHENVCMCIVCCGQNSVAVGLKWTVHVNEMVGAGHDDHECEIMIYAHRDMHAICP